MNNLTWKKLIYYFPMSDFTKEEDGKLETLRQGTDGVLKVKGIELPIKEDWIDHHLYTSKMWNMETAQKKWIEWKEMGLAMGTYLLKNNNDSFILFGVDPITYEKYYILVPDNIMITLYNMK